MWWEREFGDPYADPSRYVESSPHRRVGSIRTPMLVVHGEQDHRVPVGEALRLWTDLGEWWHRETGLPLPLGGNVVRRDLGPALMREIARDVKASIAYGLAHRDQALAHAKAFSRGMDDARTDQFVGMYVNGYTLDYGRDGRRAVEELLSRAQRAGLIPAPVAVTFVAAGH